MIARFLPRRLGQMLMLYLRDVMPFRKLIDLNNFPAHGFLFGNADGHWKTECQTKAIVRETSDHLGFRLTSQEYRQIVKAFDRQFIRGYRSGNDSGSDSGDLDDDIHD